MEHYQQTVRPAHLPGGGVPAVVGLLTAGRAEEALIRAASGYALWCRTNSRDAKMRQSAKRFYGERGAHKDFLDWTPPPSRPARPVSIPPSVLATRSLADIYAEIPAPATPGAAQGARSTGETGKGSVVPVGPPGTDIPGLPGLV